MRRAAITQSRPRPLPYPYPPSRHPGAGCAMPAASGCSRGKSTLRGVVRRTLALVLALSGVAAVGSPVALGDTPSGSLYVGDQTSNTVQSFDALDNPFTFMAAPTSVTGPRGILRLGDGNFLVAYQNPGQPFPGEIDQYNGNGDLLGSLVPSSDPHAPFAPRGIILGPDNRTLYVADFGRKSIGAVEQYDASTGQFLHKLNFSSFILNAA
jgi:DNA-binding beta-propeller fold protein YncE